MINGWRIRVIIGLWGCLVFAASTRAQTAFNPADLSPWQPPPTWKFLPGPILLTGDGDNLWACQPISVNSKPAFQLYVHPVNQQFQEHLLWIEIPTGVTSMARGMPRTLAIVSPDGKSHELAVDLLDGDGALYQADPEQTRFLKQLYGQTPVVAVGFGADLFALTLGPETFDPNATSFPLSAQPARTQGLATTSAPFSTMPATAIAPRLNQYWNFLVYHDGRWEQRAALGPASDANLTPGTGTPVLVVHYGKIVAAWLGMDHQLVVRSIDPSDAAAGWSTTITSAAPPDAASVLALSIDPRAFILFPHKNAQTANSELLGGPLSPDYRLDQNQWLPPMNLGPAISGPIDGTVAAGVSGNSIVAVFTNKQDNLASAIFSAQGQRIAEPAAMEPAKMEPRDNSLFPSLAMAVLVALLAVSLWQFQQRQQTPPTAKPARVAHVSMRLAAAAIDFAIPLILVIACFQIFAPLDEKLTKIGEVWNQGLPSWTNILESPELMLIFGIYLVHVTVGELFWGRSIGKRICHLRVIALDGSKPTALAIIVRNVIRIFEMLAGILLIYMLINPNRQRLGDLLARTMVISEEPTQEKPRKDV